MYQQSPEALFRSSSLVAMDNTISEWSFADHFFGQPTLGIDQQNIDSTDSTLFPNTPISGSGRSTPMVRKASFVSSITDPNSYLTGTPSKINSNNGTFTNSLLSGENLPDTNSIYAMV
ncbi:hypothetical protein MJO28_016669 [Puccinia striiformis f. sp. tritici]|uniref:Uncharacterized protein n=1 Tax=Puccinia striiformis f. sp. tritici TaxID=168172 RepID=A0ACC0DQ94_9BASI|nr:hypothetical protein MJO28_016669 [Puccinia striiformis f. sp. tritici]